jgi:Tfp pilus assembly protein PilE
MNQQPMELLAAYVTCVVIGIVSVVAIQKWTKYVEASTARRNEAT